MHRFMRSIPKQPLFLSLGPRWSIKNILFNQAAFIELRSEFTKRLYPGVVVARGPFSNLKSKTNDETQAILQVEFPSLLNQPIRGLLSPLTIFGISCSLESRPPSRLCTLDVASRLAQAVACVGLGRRPEMARLMARLWREYDRIVARLTARIWREHIYTNFLIGRDLHGIRKRLPLCSPKSDYIRDWWSGRCVATGWLLDGPRR
jgi:hypothetical protein